jgi:hypothetical protein
LYLVLRQCIRIIIQAVVEITNRRTLNTTLTITINTIRYLGLLLRHSIRIIVEACLEHKELWRLYGRCTRGTLVCLYVNISLDVLYGVVQALATGADFVHHLEDCAHLARYTWGSTPLEEEEEVTQEGALTNAGDQ